MYHRVLAVTAAALGFWACAEDVGDVAPASDAERENEEVALPTPGGPASSEGILERKLGERLGLRKTGDRSRLGDGYATTYVQRAPDGSPAAIGVTLDEAALEALPTSAHDNLHCWDADENGAISEHECTGGHQRVLFLPEDTGGTPFSWVGLHWNPHGHPPAEIYGAPHFDAHFYIQDYAARNAIRLGSCSGLTNCEDFETATMPVAEEFVPDGYADVGAVEAKMGNHLIDLTAPEFHGEPFTRTFILGTYGGSITFWEPMITLAYLESRPSECAPIKQPRSYEIPGYYPTKYCVRHRPARRAYDISLERFVRRDGT